MIKNKYRGTCVNAIKMFCSIKRETLMYYDDKCININL